MTTDVVQRLHEHNAGKVRSTKDRRPFELIYQESNYTCTQAREREKILKSVAGRRYLDEKIG